MKFCLDTSVIVRSLRGRGAEVKDRLRREGPGSILIPEMVRAELLTGSLKSARPEENLELVRCFLAPFVLLPFAGEAVEHFAEIRIALEKEGRKIGPNDLVIAAISRVAGAVLVTDNLGEFERVPALRCERW